MLLQTDRITIAEFEAGTGWQIKPEGACRGEVCVPLGGNEVRDGNVDIPALGERMGMALVRHDGSLAALGPATPAGRALSTAEAPELVLDDFEGNPFRLASLRGEKVVLVAWAPY